MPYSAVNRGSVHHMNYCIKVLVTTICLISIREVLLERYRRKVMQILSTPIELRQHGYLSPPVAFKVADKRHNSTNDKSATSAHTNDSKTETNEDVNQISDEDFNNVLWPQIRQKLCPGGVPDHSLGPTLFDLGRKEMGIPGKSDSSARMFSNRSVKNRKKGRTFTEFFYSGDFGFTVFIDGQDPTNTVFYAPIWKCANDQIHSYLHQIFNRKSSGDVRRPDLPVGNDNDFYLETLKYSKMSRLFGKQMRSSLQDSKDGKLGDNQNQTSTATTNNDGGDYYFRFNQTERDKPCSFTVIRDPVSHFLSGYNEVEFRLITGASDAPPASKHDELAPYSRISVFENASSSNAGSEEHESAWINGNHTASRKLREKRFERFVRDVLEEHPSFVDFPYYIHFASMTRILPTLSRLDLLPAPAPSLPSSSSPKSPNSNNGSNHHWFVPTLKNLTETFPAFLARRCPRVAVNYNRQAKGTDGHGEGLHSLPPMPVRGKHASSEDRYGTYRAAKDVWNRGGEVARSLCQLHAIDYGCYSGSYDNDGDYGGGAMLHGLEIPPVCRDVYSSDVFLDAIL